jgi:GTP-binding protein
VKIAASFVRSAVREADLPHDGLAEIALVGRSNVGKSSLINALVRQRVARTSAAPGKTRLANVYRVVRGLAAPLYVLDLPGYGYARRSKDAGEVTFEAIAATVFARQPAALLLVDARHPGLEADRQAWQWLKTAAAPGGAGSCAIVATKIDKLSRAERLRAMREMEAVFECPVLPVSAVTGEGLDELWTLIDRTANNGHPRRSSRPPKPTAPPPAPMDRPRRPPTRLGAAPSAPKGRHRKN